MDDRLIETSAQVFARIVERAVEREFEARRVLPDDVCAIPAIGGTYRPHAPQEQQVALKQMVVQALCARRWFEDEAPRWAQPLPLREDECVALFNPEPNIADADRRRSYLVGEYALQLRRMHWDYRRATPFEVFCANLLVPPPVDRGMGGY